MSKIQLRRGTKAQLDALVSGSYLDDGELGFTTDTKEVFVGTGLTNPKHLIGGVQFDVFASRPVASVAGRIFHATDTNNTYLDDGTVWNSMGVSDLSSMSGDLDDISDGTNYGKVLNTEITSGQINRLDDGAYDATAQQVSEHINDTVTDVHHEINDSGTSSTEIWSADKINTEIAAVVSGIDPQESIISQTDLTSTLSPSTGDRYINTTTGTAGDGGGSITVNNIYEWLGSAWDEITVSEGMHTWDESIDAAYIFDGAAWVKFGSTVTHNNLSTIQGGTTDEYYHLTSAEVTDLTDNGTCSIHNHDDIYFTETELENTSSAVASGANKIGVFDDFDNSDSSTVQDVLKDLDGAMSTSTYDDEDARDAVGAIMTSSTSITMTYTDNGDATSKIEADLLLADGGSF